MATSTIVEGRDDLSIVKFLDDGLGTGNEENRRLMLVRRASDGELLVGEVGDGKGKPDWLLETIDQPEGAGGVGEMLMNLLNHENLLSIAGVMRVPSPPSAAAAGSSASAAKGKSKASASGLQPAQRYLVWDWCDAGTLATMFDNPPVEKTETGFLPPSLCWHVLVSLLRALAWLHDGYREDEYTYAVRETIGGHDDDKGKGREEDKEGDNDDDGDADDGARFEVRHDVNEWIADMDWLPVLHRNITPENVFFQQPRGSETYGLCKLGNYSRVHVSGHVADYAKESYLLASYEGDGTAKELASLRSVIEKGGEAIRKLSKEKRPYTRGTELYAVGALLYRMMTGTSLPDPEADSCEVCGCPHGSSAGAASVPSLSSSLTGSSSSSSSSSAADVCDHDCCFRAREIAAVLDVGDGGSGRSLLAEHTDYHGLDHADWGLDAVVGSLLRLHRSPLRAATCDVYRYARDAWQTWMRADEDGRRVVTLEEDIRRRWGNDWRRERERARGVGSMCVGVPESLGL